MMISRAFLVLAVCSILLRSECSSSSIAAFSPVAPWPLGSMGQACNLAHCLPRPGMRLNSPATGEARRSAGAVRRAGCGLNGLRAAEIRVNQKAPTIPVVQGPVGTPPLLPGAVQRLNSPIETVTAAIEVATTFAAVDKTFGGRWQASLIPPAVSILPTPPSSRKFAKKGVEPCPRNSLYSLCRTLLWLPLPRSQSLCTVVLLPVHGRLVSVPSCVHALAHHRRHQSSDTGNSSSVSSPLLLYLAGTESYGDNGKEVTGIASLVTVSDLQTDEDGKIEAVTMRGVGRALVDRVRLVDGTVVVSDRWRRVIDEPVMSYMHSLEALRIEADQVSFLHNQRRKLLRSIASKTQSLEMCDIDGVCDLERLLELGPGDALPPSPTHPLTHSQIHTFTHSLTLPLSLKCVHLQPGAAGLARPFLCLLLVAQSQILCSQSVQMCMPRLWSSLRLPRAGGVGTGR